MQAREKLKPEFERSGVHLTVTPFFVQAAVNALQKFPIVNSSLEGDTIVYTTRQATHDLWAINPDGSNARRLTSGPADNQGATWAPNGRHLAFQSNRLGAWQLFSMLSDGSEQTPITRGSGEYTSPSWSPRLP